MPNSPVPHTPAQWTHPSQILCCLDSVNIYNMVHVQMYISMGKKPTQYYGSFLHNSSSNMQQISTRFHVGALSPHGYLMF